MPHNQLSLRYRNHKGTRLAGLHRAFRSLSAALIPVRFGFSFILIALVIMIAWPRPVSAHASLLEASPAAGAHLEAAPSAIRLIFSERIEPAVGALQVLNGRSDSVVRAKPELSEDHRMLTLALPKLEEGVYTVSYRIISADGHPVGGSYVFVVGSPPAAKDAEVFDLHAQLGHSGHSSHSGAGLSTQELLLYAARFLYYAALMLATGAALWMLLYRRWKEIPEPLRGRLERIPGKALLPASLIYVFMESMELMEGQAGSEWLLLFTRTTVGVTWTALLLLAAAGLMLPRRLRRVRALWALLLLAQEAWSGHAAALSVKWAALPLDFIHLATAALWAGGLMLLLALWAGDRKEAGRFAAKFSSAAWISIAALTLTGVLLALLMVTRLSYVLLTPWGILLLVKSGLVLLVILAGAMMRVRMRRVGWPQSFLLKADGMLMALIVMIAAVFTYMSPLPPNEPVAWHKMGSAMHVSVSITPNVPGNNEFTVRVWMFNKLGQPKSVHLRLISDDKPELSAIEVPVQPFNDDEISEFDGYTKFAYAVKGTYLPFAGKWTAEIRVLDSNDDEHVERTSFRSY